VTTPLVDIDAVNTGAINSVSLTTVRYRVVAVR
jgi:hypothetical protein